MRIHLSRKAGVALAGVAATLVAAPSASANVFTAGPLFQVPDQPLYAAGQCANTIAAGTNAGDVNYPGSEVEPMVAVDPSNPQHLVAAYQQDRWKNGGANGNIAVVSNNGGANWALSAVQAPFSICTGGALQRTSDPVVAISSNGATVYQAAVALNVGGLASGTNAILVSTSTDGGAMWNVPRVIRTDPLRANLNDKEWITADPTNAAAAYVVWDRLDPFGPVLRGPSWFSKTTDAGATWSAAKEIYDPGIYDQTIGNEIVAPAVGPAARDLLDFFVRIKTFFGLSMDIGVVRSTDGGQQWSAPTWVSGIQQAEARSLTGEPYRTADNIPQFTVSPTNGNLYATWQDGRFSTTGLPAIAFSQSTNGGTTWSQAIKIDQAPLGAQAFTPQIAVNSHGTVAVSYYDTQNANGFRPGRVDEYIVHCHAATANCANAASWAAGGETRLSPNSFVMTTAPSSPLGYFTGDYEGLAASGTVFDPFFVMGQPVATAGPTDAFSTTAQ